MTPNIGYAEGFCPECGKRIRRRRPDTLAACDCYRNCPICGKEMEPYTPDLTPSTYGPIESEAAIGDTEKPTDILYHCPDCRYYSSLKPVEVRLS